MNRATIISLFVFLSFVFSGNCQSTNSQASPGQISLYTRAYKVEKAFIQKLEECEPAKKIESYQEKLLIYLKENDIVITPPAKVRLDETNGVLFVKSTAANLDKVEKLLQKIEKAK
jgi:hypothetical protein